MARYKSNAFILDAADYGETSRLLHVFCENEGRISLIAKGLRSPRSRSAFAADSFNLVQITYTLKDNSGLGLLSSIDLEQSFPGLRKRLNAYALVNFWFEVIKAATQERANLSGLFLLTKSLLLDLDSSAAGGIPYLYFIELFQLLGFGVRFTICAQCGSVNSLDRFDPAAGSIFCTNCRDAHRRAIAVSEDLVKELARPPHLVSMQTVLPTQLGREFLRLTNHYLSFHLDHRFRTFTFLENMLVQAERTKT